MKAGAGGIKYSIILCNFAQQEVPTYTRGLYLLRNSSNILISTRFVSSMNDQTYQGKFDLDCPLVYPYCTQIQKQNMLSK